MPQDALTQSAAALGIQTEPAVNFFDPAQSRRLMARYAPVSPEVASSAMLAEQANKEQMAEMHRAVNARELALWGRQKEKFAEEDQAKLHRGEFLAQIAKLDPLDPEYLTKKTEIVSGLPDSVMQDDAVRDVFHRHDSIFDADQASKYKQKTLEEHGLQVKSNYVNRSIDSAVRRGVKPEAIAALPKDEYGLPDPVAVAELQSGVVTSQNEAKEQKKLDAKNYAEDMRDIGSLDPKDSGARVKLAYMKGLPQLEALKKELDSKFKDGILTTQRGPVTEDELASNRADFVRSVTERFMFAEPDEYNGSGTSGVPWNKDRKTPAVQVIGVKDKAPSATQLRKYTSAVQQARLYWDTNMALQRKRLRVGEAGGIDMDAEQKLLDQQLKDEGVDIPPPPAETPAAVTPTAPEPPVAAPVPAIKTKEERDKLPIGTKYIGPDGKTYQKQ